MKNTFLLLFFLVGMLVSCTTKTTETISFNDFDRLIKTDSIRSVQVYNDEALITKKSATSNSENFVLQIPSSVDFRNKLEGRYANNRIPSIIYIHNGGFNGMSILVNLIPFLFAAGILVLFLISAADILKNRFPSDIEKLIWILVVIFVPFFGALLYLLIGRKQKLKYE